MNIEFVFIQQLFFCQWEGIVWYLTVVNYLSSR